MTTNTTPKPAPVAPDWERIELDYRAGIKTLRQIAGEHGITEGAIRKRAKRDGWERDLAGKIQAKADAIVQRAALRDATRPTPAAEREVIETAALAVADVRLAHRADIHRTRRICMNLLDELDYQTGAENVALLQELGEMMRSPDSYGRDKLNDLYHKIISLPGRAKTMKELSDSLRILVALERQAFGMDADDTRPVDGFSSMLARITSGTGNGFMPVADDPELQDE